MLQIKDAMQKGMLARGTCPQWASSLQACHPSTYPLQMPDPTVAFDFMHAAGLCSAFDWMFRAHASWVGTDFGGTKQDMVSTLETAP